MVTEISFPPRFTLVVKLVGGRGTPGTSPKQKRVVARSRAMATGRKRMGIDSGDLFGHRGQSPGPDFHQDQPAIRIIASIEHGDLQPALGIQTKPIKPVAWPRLFLGKVAD